VSPFTDPSGAGLTAPPKPVGLPSLGWSSITRIAKRYAIRMAQLVTRIDERLASLIDELIEAGVVASRSDAVRRGLRVLIEQHRRSRTAQAIVRGYRDLPQSEEEVGWADEATARMIGDEPW